MKRKLCLLLVLSLVFIIIGCDKKQVSLNELIDMYNEKYDDNFIFVSEGGQVWTSNYWEVTLLSSKLDKHVTVHIYENGTTDNYIPLKYKKHVEDKVKAIAEGVYGEARAINLPMRYGNGTFKENMTFEEYASASGSLIHTALIVNKSLKERDSDIEKLRVALEKEQILSRISIYYYPGKEIDEIEIRDEVFLTLFPEAKCTGYLKLEKDYSVRSLDWDDNEE